MALTMPKSQHTPKSLVVGLVFLELVTIVILTKWLWLVMHA